MAANPQTPLSGLARALIQQGRVTEADAIACTEAAGNTTNGFIVELDRRAILKSLDIARFAADTFGCPLLDVAALDVTATPKDAVDRKLLAKHQVVPLARRQNRLVIATADPSNMRALDEIRFQSGMQVEVVVAEAAKLAKIVEKLAESAEETLRELTGEGIELDLLESVAGGETPSDEANQEVDDAPVVRYIQKILIDAINEGASDIHFEPYEKH